MQGRDALPHAHQTRKPTALFPVNLFAKPS
jgi:hypothetical protein